MSDKKFWGDKPYFSLDHYLKQTFGEKVYRLSLNGGMTCPNRDGTLDSRGCIFCSAGGSGDFATAPSLSVTEQITQAKERIRRKSNCRKFIAYFQAYTNTYAPVSYLRELFTEAIEQPDIASLSIATRSARSALRTELPKTCLDRTWSAIHSQRYAAADPERFHL